MKILVTGGAGFIGSHLVDRLVELGHSVRVYDCLDPQVHPGSRAPDYLNPDAEFIKGDVRDRESLENALDGMEAVFHFAAAVGVSQSQYRISHYVDVNINGTAVLMDIIVNSPKAKSIKKVIIPGSMTSYGEGAYFCPSCGRVRPGLRSENFVGPDNWEPKCPLCGASGIKTLAISEDDSFDCSSIYGLGKRDQEEMARLLTKIHGIPTVVLRYFNVYGPRQSLSNPYTGVMSIFISRIKNGAKPVVYEDGCQTRDFIHVKDVVDANVKALERPDRSFLVCNIGTGIAVEIGEIARKLIALMGAGSEPEITGRFRKGDIRHCFPDISRARKELGFEPAVRLEEGMKELIGWAGGQSADDRFADASSELEKKGIL